MMEADNLVGKQFGIGRSLVQCSLDYTELLVRSHEVSVNMNSELHIWLNDDPKIIHLFYNLLFMVMKWVVWELAFTVEKQDFAFLNI